MTNQLARNRAARDIDATGYPLVRQPFSEAEPGVWFSRTKVTSGLLLPSLSPALDGEAAKRPFFRGSVFYGGFHNPPGAHLGKLAGGASLVLGSAEG
jgi:hypothetical protein